MINTKEIEVDLGNKSIKIKIVKNSEEILIDSLDADETPLWVELWPSSLAIAKWLWASQCIEGKTVLELGAGLGLPGIVAGLKGAYVLQTDYASEALEVARETACMNNLPNVKTAIADWRHFEISDTFDYIIGSDILYHPDLNPFLKSIFLNNLSPGGKIIMAEAGRKGSLDFIEELRLAGWDILEEHIQIKQEPFDYKIYLYQISPPLL
jgi:predicted nicotinamide N-methyase